MYGVIIVTSIIILSLSFKESKAASLSGTPINLTQHPQSDLSPAWSPDGGAGE